MEITRGDTKYFKFQRKRKHDSEVIEDLPNKLYFTIKYSNTDENILIQKTLKNGIKYNTNDKYYYITINPEDTNNLPYGKYYYDIEVIKDNNYKQTIAIGEINITSEVTFYGNEG
ncbi:hypothetical protein [uncultured Rikenella sp.]|uniref:hypothetical protein n=1 Tax=uncultured Rikenella sp. TaxID=368003 RepID=UPI002616F17D|nr:hypothetical protein [uncultured Rikenella sp.]